MIKYNHTHLPAKRHTGLFKPCYGGKNIGVFEHYKKGFFEFMHTLEADFLHTLEVDFFESIKKGKTYFLNTLEVDFLDTLKNFGKPQFKRLPQNRATSNILGAINDFSEQYAHVRVKASMDLLRMLRASTFFNIKKLSKYEIPGKTRGLSKGVDQTIRYLNNIMPTDKHSPICTFDQVTKVKDFINSAFETLNSINTLTHNKYEGYYEDLSNSNSGQPFRYLLAFFVPDNWLNSQLNQSISTKPPILSQDRTVMSMVKNLPPSYNGLTLQNKKALWRICRAVSVRAESKTRYPMFNHIVAFTQNLTGGHNHA